MPLTEDADIRALLQETRTIAMVGASAKPERASNGVLAFLLAHGYDVIPVNPGHAGGAIHGRRVFENLSSIEDAIDLVDIFRNSREAGAVVDDAVAAGAKAVWMQLGVVDEDAAARAEAAGLKVVMDRCPKIEIHRLGV